MERAGQHMVQHCMEAGSSTAPVSELETKSMKYLYFDTSSRVLAERTGTLYKDQSRDGELSDSLFSASSEDEKATKDSRKPSVEEEAAEEAKEEDRVSVQGDTGEEQDQEEEKIR